MRLLPGSVEHIKIVNRERRIHRDGYKGVKNTIRLLPGSVNPMRLLPGSVEHIEIVTRQR
jgi:hypothetical protein